MRIFETENCLSVSISYAIYHTLVAQVDYNSMNLPMKILSKKGIEIVKEGFVDSGAGGKFYQPELHLN